MMGRSIVKNSSGRVSEKNTYSYVNVSNSTLFSHTTAGAYNTDTSNAMTGTSHPSQSAPNALCFYINEAPLYYAASRYAASPPSRDSISNPFSRSSRATISHRIPFEQIVTIF